MNGDKDEEGEFERDLRALIECEVDADIVAPINVGVAIAVLV